MSASDSVKFSITMDKAMVKFITEDTKESGIGRSEWIRAAITESIARKRKSKLEDN